MITKCCGNTSSKQVLSAFLAIIQCFCSWIFRYSLRHMCIRQVRREGYRYKDTHQSTIYNGRKLEAIQMPIKKSMGK